MSLMGRTATAATGQNRTPSHRAEYGQKQSYSNQNRQLHFVHQYDLANSHYRQESALFPNRLCVLGYGFFWLIAGILAYRKPHNGVRFCWHRLDTFLE